MKRTTQRMVGKALGIGLFVFVSILAGCDGGSNDTMWLNGLKNPFIGKWQSKIPSMNNATMVSEYATDGTFTCIFPDLPQEQGGGVEYTGAYLVTGNVMVTFMSGDGGMGGYTFAVVDNDTINVTEIADVDEETGTYTAGNTAPFKRVSGSKVDKTDKPFALSNGLINGTWSETSSGYNATYSFKADGTGTQSYTGVAPFAIAYSVFHDEGIDKDVLIVFMSAYKTFAAYAFEQQNGGNSISVKEITEIAMGQQGPTATYGTAIDFTR